MEIILKMNISEEALKKEEIIMTEDEIKEHLVQMMFDVCEEWILRGQQPDFEFK